MAPSHIGAGRGRRKQAGTEGYSTVFASDSRFLAGGLALAFVALPGSAALAQDTETLTVSATVDATCELEGGSLDFGTYTSAGGIKEATGS